MPVDDWSWLESKIDHFAALGVDEASEQLTQELAKIDPRLGADVSDNEGTREVVITAGGDAEAFERVDQLVTSAPQIPRWSFVALRPPRGFEFQVQAGGMTFGAAALSFQIIAADSMPGQLALRLLVPNPELEDWAQIGLQILEVGLGERAAAAVAYLEVDRRKPDAEGVHPLESLPRHVARFGQPKG